MQEKSPGQERDIPKIPTKEELMALIKTHALPHASEEDIEKLSELLHEQYVLEQELERSYQRSKVINAFPTLCDQFERAAYKNIRDHLQRTYPTTFKECRPHLGFAGAVLGMRLKENFYLKAWNLALTPGIKRFVGDAYIDFCDQWTDRVAGLLIENLGPYHATRVVPKQMRTEFTAEYSDRKKMKNMSMLIRRSLSLD